jgi:hypothetical protein
MWRSSGPSGRPGPARYSRPVSRPPWGVPGQVRHRRPTGPGPTPPTVVMEPGITLVRTDWNQLGTPDRSVACRGGCRVGSVRPTGPPGPALLADQSPAVRGAGPSPSQKADQARPGTPTAVTEPGVRELCVFDEGGRRWWGRKSHDWVV